MMNNDYIEIFSGFKGEESDLIPILQRTQEKFRYIPKEIIKQMSRFLKISENQIYGVASFYSQFKFVEPGKFTIKVCMGTACHVRGGQILCEALERELGVSTGQTTKDKRFDLQRVACLGCCALAPVIQINDDIYSRVAVIRLKQILEKYE